MYRYVILALFVLAPLAADDLNFRRVGEFRAANTGVSLTLHQSADNSVIEFRVENTDSIVYNVTVSMDLDNMRSSVPLPYAGTVPANRTTNLFRISRVDARRAYYYRNLQWRLNVGPATVSDQPVLHKGVYRLPWPKGRTFRVDNGFNGFGAHQGPWAYAVDFIMPVGTPVHAARAGVVIATEARYTRGGNDPALANQANYVFIQHADRSIGRYLHFRPGGVSVSVNQKVKTGQLIGYSGNVGWSTDPHLHFDVTVPDGSGGMKTVPFKFRIGKAPAFEPKVGMRLTNGIGKGKGKRNKGD